MRDEFTVLFKRFSVIFIIIFIISLKFIKISTFSDLFDVVSRSVGYSVTILMIYISYLWRYDPFIKIPRLKKEYRGEIIYNHDRGAGSKEVDIKIRQTLLNIDLKITSNEMKSTSFNGIIIEENSNYYLYYNYITNPLSEASEKNPIQIGTCRIDLDDMKNIKGTYWTNRKTVGDIRLK